jgi:hypothetical protein
VESLYVRYKHHILESSSYCIKIVPVPKHRATKTYENVEAKIHAFLTTLFRDEWSLSCWDLFTSVSWMLKKDVYFSYVVVLVPPGWGLGVGLTTLSCKKENC